MTEKERTPADFLDEEKIVTSVASKAIDRILAAAESAVRNRWAKHKTKQIDELAKFVSAQARQYSMIKNILYYNEPVALNNLYVPLSFRSEHIHRAQTGSPTMDTELLQEFDAPQNLVVCATAGSGKSFFLRKALLSLSSSEGGRIPILLELKSLNGKPRRTFLELLVTQIQEYVPSFMPEQMRIGLENGSFAVLLDGYDEIEPESVTHYESEILNLAKAYSKTPIMVSTRPVESVFAWQLFKVVRVQPLSKEGAVSLIERLDFDEVVKRKFITEIQNNLYDKHRSFLSIPLLATMMLLTFSETAEIDTRITTFYNDAFNALLVRHDAKKEAFKRAFKSGLSRDDFTTLFATFCFITYSRNIYQFEESLALSVIKEACELQEIEATPNHLFEDFCVTSCMLIKEGRHYVFSHRSFQEYFAAVFINRCPNDLAKSLLQEVAEIGKDWSRSLTDNVLKILLELNPELVETTWVLPRLKAINRTIRKVPPRDYVKQFTTSFFYAEDFFLDDKQAVGIKGKMGLTLMALSRLYNLGVIETVDYAIIKKNANPGTSKGRRSNHVYVSSRKSIEKDNEKNAIPKLFELEERIETSYSRKRSKLEGIVKATTSKSRKA